MTVPESEQTMPTTATHCHCGAAWTRYGSDHCDFCGCEEYERYCNASYPDHSADHWWTPGAPRRVPPPPKCQVPPDPAAFVETAAIDFTRPQRTRRRF